MYFCNVFAKFNVISEVSAVYLGECPVMDDNICRTRRKILYDVSNVFSASKHCFGRQSKASYSFERMLRNLMSFPIICEVKPLWNSTQFPYRTIYCWFLIENIRAIRLSRYINLSDECQIVNIKIYIKYIIGQIKYENCLRFYFKSKQKIICHNNFYI